MDTLEKEFKERLDQGLEYNHSIEAIDWTILKHDGLYCIQKDAGTLECFKNVEQAVYTFLVQIGYWE